MSIVTTVYITDVRTNTVTIYGSTEDDEYAALDSISHFMSLPDDLDLNIELNEDGEGEVCDPHGNLIYTVECYYVGGQNVVEITTYKQQGSIK